MLAAACVVITCEVRRSPPERGMSETSYSQGAILRHLAVAAQEARREHAMAVALQWWFWTSRMQRSIALFRRHLALSRRRSAMRCWSHFALARRKGRAMQLAREALLRQRLRPARLRPLLRCWAQDAARRVRRRTQPLRAACFERESLLRVAYGAWRRHCAARRRAAAQRHAAARRHLERRRPAAFQQWHHWARNAAGFRKQIQRLSLQHGVELQRKGWGAWRGWLRQRTRAKERQAEARLSPRRCSKRVVALRRVLRANEERRQLQVQRLVAAWRGSLALKPWLAKWKELCERSGRPKQMLPLSSSSLEDFRQKLRAERSAQNRAEQKKMFDFSCG
eukprot:s360_g14.t1